MSDFHVFGNILLFISLIIFLVLCYIFKQPKNRIRNTFSAFVASTFLYSLSCAVFFLSSSLYIQSWMLNFQIFMFVFIPTIWFIFIATFTENLKKNYLISLIVPAIVFLLFLSNPWTDLLTYISVGTSSIKYNYISFFIFYYCIFLLFLPLILLYKFSKIKGRRYRNIIIALASIPLIH